MTRPNLLRSTGLFCLLWAAVWTLPETGAALAPEPSAAQRQKLWLRSVYKKMKKDSERLVTLTRELRAEASKHKQNPITPALLERIQGLELRAEALRAAVATSDENFLPVPVVTGAEEIKAEARALQDAFAHSPPGRLGSRLRELARQIEKRASSIASRMGLP